jgi:hypothetical protein
MQGFSGGSDNQLDAYVERLRVQLPAAPEPLLDAYVRFAPWLALIFGALGFIALLGLGILGAAISPFLLLAGAEGISSGFGLFVTIVFGLIACAADVVGGYFMLQRRIFGWWLVALGIVVSALSSLLTFALFTLVILVAIAYVHLMVKPRYS